MSVPRHVAIVMDGNGRWARSRFLPRQAGHRAGVKPVRMVIEQSARHGIEALTLFAFSSENWSRPAEEVLALMDLFIEALHKEVDELHSNHVRLRFIGNRSALSAALQSRIADAESYTRDNTGLCLQVAVSYGGRWDIINAAQGLAQDCVAGERIPAQIDETTFAARLELGTLPDPDLFIRTGGERRISNFLLWNLAYTELYFTDELWPQFNEQGFAAALEYFAERQRRFGLTGEQRGAG
jgi:undecaprenyl diphosphate synthase